MAAVETYRHDQARASVRRGRVAVIHDGFVPEYRVRLYELLHERGSAEYVVFHGEPPSSARTIAASEPFAFPHVRVGKAELGVAGRRLVYQALVGRVLRGGFDAIVIAAQLRFISSLFLLFAFKSAGRPVVLWGHGRDAGEDSGRTMRPLLAVAGGLRRRIARLADAYLAYTPGGRDHLIHAGVAPRRVRVVHNTLDVEHQIDLHARLQDEDPFALRSELRLEPDSVVLLFVGRIYREKRLGELLEAVGAIRKRELARAPLEVVVIGDGPDLRTVKEQANSLQGFHFRGSIRDQYEVARHMRVASAVVIPGKVGLAANHSFAQGLPVITRQHELHSPEVEYIRPGVNGLIVPGGMENFTRALAQFVDDADLRLSLAAGALATRGDLSAEAMAASFDEGVCAALAMSGNTTGPPHRPSRYASSTSSQGG